MSTVSYTAEVNVNGSVKVQWSSLSSGAEGEAFECAGLKLASVQYAGSFSGGGQISFQGSNEITPTNFSEIHNSGSATMQFSFSGVTQPLVAAARPVVIGSVSNVTVSALFVKA